jgi:hypothetical protein
MLTGGLSFLWNLESARWKLLYRQVWCVSRQPVFYVTVCWWRAASARQPFVSLVAVCVVPFWPPVHPSGGSQACCCCTKQTAMCPLLSMSCSDPLASPAHSLLCLCCLRVAPVPSLFPVRVAPVPSLFPGFPVSSSVYSQPGRPLSLAPRRHTCDMPPHPWHVMA